MKRTLPLILVAAFLLTGCVRTYIKSSLNPDYSGKAYGNILVMVNLSDIDSQQTAENAVVNKLLDAGVDATPSYKVFFQGEDYSKAERRARIKKNGFDSVLVINFTDSYETQAYVPSTTTTTGSYDAYGNFTAHTYQSGGYYLSQPNFDIRTRLQESNKFGTVWVSDANSHGCAICGFDRIMGSFADTLVNQLEADGVLISPSPGQK